MPIALNCPKCSVRLTLADDRHEDVIECPKCGASVRVKSVSFAGPQPSREQPKSESDQAKPGIAFICPSCESRMKVAAKKAGAEVRCPRCGQKIIVPTPTDEALPGILVETPRQVPPPRPLPLPPPPPPPPATAAFDFDTEDEEDEYDDFDYSALRKRRSRNRFAAVWRLLTISAVGVSLLCFFLPWVRYSVVIPKNQYLQQDKVEFASQSGLQATFALVSLHPILERLATKEMAIKEAEWRKKGKQPLEEWMKQSKPFMAPWLLLYPLGLVLVGIAALSSHPSTNSCLFVSAVLVGVILLLLIQFGGFGPPALSAFYDELAKDDNLMGLVLVSIFLDVQYTPWFVIAVLGIVFALFTQVGAIAVRKLA